jgi:hypothetical protein
MSIDVSVLDIGQLDALLERITEEKKQRQTTDKEITIEGLYDRRIVVSKSTTLQDPMFHITTLDTLTAKRIQSAMGKEEMEKLYKWLCRHFCCNLHR